MTPEWQYLIYLYDCGVSGKTPEPPKENVDRNALLKLANRQAVSGTVACALRKEDSCPPEIKARCSALAVQTAFANEQKIRSVLDTIRFLRDAELHPVVLKGYDIARFHAFPECRSSADTDLLFPPDEEEAVCRLLSENGFSVKPRKPGAHHGSAKRPDVGVLELHVQLWSEKTAQALFGTSAEKFLSPSAFIEADFRGETINVLKPSDAAAFLAAHLARHFIEPGIGLRQAYDFALYYARQHEKFDPEAFWQLMTDCSLDGLISAVLSLLVQSGCFRAEDFPGCKLCDAQTVNALSAHMERYDTREEAPEETDGAWEYFCAAPRGLKKRSYLRLTAIRLLERMETVFPKRSQLEGRYPYLKKRHYLYPVAWTQRSVKAIFGRQGRENISKNFSGLTNAEKTAEKEKIKQHTELMAQIGLLEK